MKHAQSLANSCYLVFGRLLVFAMVVAELVSLGSVMPSSRGIPPVQGKDGPVWANRVQTRENDGPIRQLRRCTAPAANEPANATSKASSEVMG